MRALIGLIVLVAASLLAAPGLASAETVMITGANSGIGLEFTRQYVAKGWTIIATHRRPETPKSLAEIAAKYGKLRIERLDVTNVEEVQALAKKLADVPIDVLINNAGVYNDRGSCAAEDENVEDVVHGGEHDPDDRQGDDPGYGQVPALRRGCRAVVMRGQASCSAARLTAVL